MVLYVVQVLISSVLLGPGVTSSTYGPIFICDVLVQPGSAIAPIASAMIVMYFILQHLAQVAQRTYNAILVGLVLHAAVIETAEVKDYRCNGLLYQPNAVMRATYVLTGNPD